MENTNAGETKLGAGPTTLVTDSGRGKSRVVWATLSLPGIEGKERERGRGTLAVHNAPKRRLRSAVRPTDPILTCHMLGRARK